MTDPARFTVRQALFVTITMIAFAANSVLCRLALKTTSIDPASFTTIRLTSGALTLALIVYTRSKVGDGSRVGVGDEDSGSSPIPGLSGSWPAAIALFTYAAAFSYAYSALPAAVGALILFGSVQMTMIAYGLQNGERFKVPQWCGFGLAAGGLIDLFVPGLSAPDLFSAALMLLAGIAWGAYSLLGRKLGNPSAATAGNFIFALPFTLALSVLMTGSMNLDTRGVGLAVASGALASGVGYSIWYAVLPSLTATLAATVQLSVPVIAMLGGVLFLGETLTPRLVVGSLSILSGIAMVIACRSRQVK